jgi:hypothetical protein
MWRNIIRQWLNPRQAGGRRCQLSKRLQLAVERLEARDVPTVFTVVNTLDSGAGSLRWAIEQANTNVGVFDQIRFNIPGPASAVHTITPASPLPALTDAAGALIDGYSQPGAAPNTLPVGSNAQMRIEIDGSAAGVGADGLRLTAGSNKVRGLVINGFDEFGIHVTSSRGNAIAGNYVGTDPTGLVDRSRMTAGVYVESDAPNNFIGGTSPGERNLLSGNGDSSVSSHRRGSGVTIMSEGNVVAGNYIGTDATGVAALPNVGDVNFGAINNYGEGNKIEDNVIAGNIGNGILMFNSTLHSPTPLPTFIRGNTIGLGADGTTPLGNLYGIYLALDSRNVTIGGTIPAARNVISGNGGFGIVLDVGAANTTIQGNYIGTDQSGLLARGNVGQGIYDYGTTGLKVGGLTSTPGTGAGNVISGNTGSGVALAGVGTTGAVVCGNIIGLGADGETALGAQQIGVYVQQVHFAGLGNTIGGTLSRARNVVSGNSEYGVLLEGAAAAHFQVVGNYIGTDITGALPRGNGTGVTLDRGANNNQIGGAAAGAGNLISGNTNDGINIVGADYNLVAGNRIGTDATGTHVVWNLGSGVALRSGASYNQIGTASAGGRNVITGNGAAGVSVYGSAEVAPDTFHNSIVGNFIGSDASGTTSLTADALTIGVAVRDGGANTTIGGAGAGEANVISANAYGLVLDHASGVFALGNRIGTDATGSRALANESAGIKVVGGNGNRIGATGPGEANVISGNGVGIYVTNLTGAVDFTTIEGNLIGVNAAGTRPLPNSVGISIIDEASSSAATSGPLVHDIVIRANRIENNLDGVTISGPLATAITVVDNTIEFSDQDGITLQGGTHDNEIGGLGPTDGNVISGNDDIGVLINSFAPFSWVTADNRVEGNFIGTDRTGLLAIPNVVGVAVANSQRNVFETNIISGNVRQGVVIQGAHAANNVLQWKNLIGVDASGRRLGNGAEGVLIGGGAHDNVIGGNSTGSDPSAMNEIAYNALGGVVVGSTSADGSAGNTVRFNSIHDNGGLGIDLGADGPTPNHFPPSDTGPNLLQNHPYLSAFTALGTTHVSGVLTDRTGRFVVDIYSSPGPDASGFGEGALYLGSRVVTVPPSGVATFSLDVPALAAHWVLSATATRVDTGDTSEFSQAVLPTPLPVTPLIAMVPFFPSAADAAALEAALVQQKSVLWGLDDALVTLLAKGGQSADHVSPVAGKTNVSDDSAALAGVLIGL